MNGTVDVHRNTEHVIPSLFVMINGWKQGRPNFVEFNYEKFGNLFEKMERKNKNSNFKLSLEEMAATNGSHWKLSSDSKGKESEKIYSSSLPNISTSHHWEHHQVNGNKDKDLPFIIGVAGGTASGKTSVCEIIVEELGIDRSRVAIISQDCFYKTLSPESIKNVKKYNFDHPDAFDWDLMEQTLKDLREGKPIKVPIYDYVTHSRKSETTNLCAIDIVLFEGLLVFYEAKIMQFMHMKIFVDTDSDIRLARRIRRDIRERGRDVDGVLLQYQVFVKPAFDEYILPTKKYADVIIPNGSENVVGINLIVQHVKSKLEVKKKVQFNSSRKKNPPPSPIKMKAPERTNSSEHFTFGHLDDSLEEEELMHST
eukprot:TRINITY_DN2504_c0_g1_i1.p1 TRINITY_DN2504_c0_g1~~TRINITY_DN2504_c0_g1_i1.p1  ORF type:complete len:369 (+),score=113.68 TRINITY_DN2504_c0_g1_i1:68-1174(+)